REGDRTEIVFVRLSFKFATAHGFGVSELPATEYETDAVERVTHEDLAIYARTVAKRIAIEENVAGDGFAIHAAEGEETPVALIRLTPKSFGRLKPKRVVKPALAKVCTLPSEPPACGVRSTPRN